MAENLNNVTHEKEEENIGNLRKRSFFSSIMKTVALITLDFISRDMNKEHFVLLDKQNVYYFMKNRLSTLDHFFQKMVKLDQFDVELIS